MDLSRVSDPDPVFDREYYKRLRDLKWICLVVEARSPIGALEV